jgi:hypothetical protein
MREPWIVTSLDGTVRERVLAENTNQAHQEAEQNLRRQGRPVPSSIEMVAKRERRETDPDYERY